jgi:hypothetical protein
MSKIILISGKAEHGKTVTAKIIEEHLENNGKRVLIIPFANYLKFICEKYFDWNGKKDAEGRHILQYVGTDIVRNRCPDFWVKTVVDFVKVFSEEFDFFIVDDCRFINEVECFSGMDYLTIRVARFDFENSLSKEQRRHRSEMELDDFQFDRYVGCESGINNLKEQIDLVLLDHPLWKNWFELESNNETTNN